MSKKQLPRGQGAVALRVAAASLVLIISSTLGAAGGRPSPGTASNPGEFARLEIAAGEDLRNESFGARRIARVGETSFIGYSELVGKAWHIRVRTYDHRRGELGPAREIVSGTDDHSIMALAADSRGFLHCVTGGHGRVIYTRTVRPADASAWTAPETISPEGTYCMMVIDRHDRLYAFYRREWINLEMRSRPAGGPWDPPVRIAVTTGNKGFYIMGIALGGEPGRQSLHVVGHFYGEPEAYGLSWPKETYGYRIRPWYIRSLDGGATWTKADGTPLPHGFPDAAIDLLFDQEQPYDIPWSVDIALDAANRPHIFCARSDRLAAPGRTLREVQEEIGRRPSRLEEWTWEAGGGWRSRRISTPALAGRHISHPTAVIVDGMVHLFATTSESAAARVTGEQTIGRLWHGWSRGDGLWGEEILDEGTGYANVKLPDASGAIEVMWRGTPHEGAGRVALHYAAWPAAALRAAAAPTLSLRESALVIPQVDYEGAVFRKPGDPYAHLDFAAVRPDRIVDRTHRAIVMENEYVKLTLLPDMGRVYSLVYKPTGHEVFWRNDIVTVGTAQNPLGWWLWIGGEEFTLPGDEHGTTWAEPWTSSLIEDGERRKAVCLSVVERGTGLREEVALAVARGCAGFEACIRITNPTDKDVAYAHWVNPQWTPGGWNELADGTEFIIPTSGILVPGRYRATLGPSPQRWDSNSLRFIDGWDKGWGDLMADGLRAGFFGAYSHADEEGVARIFDKELSPGLDVWTYGYHPEGERKIPMGSGAASRGYVEMWGGTSKTFPDERHPLGPGANIGWSERIVPFQRTGGLTAAEGDFAVCLARAGGAARAGRSGKEADGRKVRLAICPARVFEDLRLRLMEGDRTVWETRTALLSPDQPFEAVIDDLGKTRPTSLVITSKGRGVLKTIPLPPVD